MYFMQTNNKQQIRIQLEQYMRHLPILPHLVFQILSFKRKGKKKKNLENGKIQNAFRLFIIL